MNRRKMLLYTDIEYFNLGQEATWLCTANLGGIGDRQAFQTPRDECVGIAFLSSVTPTQRGW